ncbi:MAG: hypothetical protein KDG89_00380 [Geminicoccaceae bacterium]|nr:hypothetical protein [Geminicoccaceae bacterium]
MRHRPFIITRNFARPGPDLDEPKAVPTDAAGVPEGVAPCGREPTGTALTFTEDEVAPMLAAAVAEGRRMGASEATGGFAARKAEAIEAVAASLGRLEAESHARAATARAQATEILQAVVRAYGAAAAERRVADAALHLVDHCLAHLPNDAVLELGVAPAAIEYVQPRLLPLAARVALTPDAGLEPGGVRASWKGGWAAHRPELLQAAVDKALEALTMNDARETIGC